MSAASFNRLSPSRLSALRSSGLLDLAGAEQFSHLTDHLRTILGVPIAIVSLVDEHRQVFAGHSGLPEPWASQGQTPITHSFCQHVIDRGTALVITNANAEPLVRGNPAIRDLGVVAYLGVPLHLPTGELIGALAAIDTRKHAWTEDELRVVRSTARIVEREIRLAGSERQYRRMFDEMQEGFYVARGVRGADGQLSDVRFDDVNPAFERLTGLTADAAVGSTLSMLAPASHASLLPVFGQVLDDGASVAHVSRSTVVPGHWFENRLSPLGDERLVGFFSDVTDHHERADRDAQLRNELRHRLGNLFTTVQSLTMHTLREVSDRAPIHALQQRIFALSAAHDVLLRKPWQGASVRAVAEAAIARFGVAGRVDVGGPPIELQPRISVALSLLLHELLTNAVRHGAFANEAGRVQLVWSTAEDTFALAWIESGGPPVTSPAAPGLGSRLIQLGVGVGQVRTEFEPEGFSMELAAPLSRIQASD